MVRDITGKRTPKVIGLLFKRTSEQKAAGYTSEQKSAWLREKKIVNRPVIKAHIAFIRMLEKKYGDDKQVKQKYLAFMKAHPNLTPKEIRVAARNLAKTQE